MATLALIQTAATPEWVAPTMAVSLAVLALCVLAITVALAVTLARVLAELQRVGVMLDGVQDDVRQTIGTARRLTEQGQDLVVLLRHEIGAFAQTGRRVRRKVVRGVDRMESRLTDLETLYDLVHEEVEDTALEVAAALRSARSGNGMLGRVRRLLVPRRG